MNTPGTLTHVVLVQWRIDAPSEDIRRLGELIARFPAEIPGVIDVVHGASVSTEGLESGFEWALVVTFADADARDGYLDHPAHVPVAELIGTWAERLVVFDVTA